MRKKTSVLLETYLRTHPSILGQVKTFQSGKDLLSQVEGADGFDIYFLDILMPGLSGIDIGRRLRRRGDGGEIIYLTSSNDFAADSYDVRAFFYLLKPVEEHRLFQVLDDGQSVALPRTAATDFKKAWENYWLEEDAIW